MSRIRTLKPEWLEDEKLAACSDEARVLSAGLILLADDQGRGRASVPYLASQVWTYHPRESLAKVSKALAELAGIQFVILYAVSGEQYYQIRSWSKHQKVDHPGKPRLPGPKEADSQDSREDVAKVPDTLAPHTSDLRPPTTDQDQEGPTEGGVSGNALDLKAEFSQFWECYPRKRAKGDALKAWLQLKPTPELVATILAAIDQHKLADDWRRENGRFIPHPATWIRGRRWEDQLAVPPPGNGTDATVSTPAPLRPNAEVDRLRQIEAEIARERRTAGDGDTR